MEAEQINEEVKMTIKDLSHLWHIKKRIKNEGAIAKHVLENINEKTYLSVYSSEKAHQERAHDTAGQKKQV